MTGKHPFRALIAEDEPILAAALAHALQRLWPDLDIVAQCGNGVEALEQGLALRPDIFFLDIKMPGKTGLETAEELANSWPEQQAFPQIVFVTAYDEFALAAFDNAAADYVLKPISDARLGKTVERLRQRLSYAGTSVQSKPQDQAPDRLALLLGTLQGMLPSAERLTTIRAAVGNQVRLIPVNDVVYFESGDKYLNVVTTQHGEALIRTSLKELLPQLDRRQFWQVHRGTIVNADYILSAVRDEIGKLSLNLRGRPEQLRVSPLYAHLFRQM